MVGVKHTIPAFANITITDISHMLHSRMCWMRTDQYLCHIKYMSTWARDDCVFAAQTNKFSKWDCDSCRRAASRRTANKWLVDDAMRYNDIAGCPHC